MIFAIFLKMALPILARKWKFWNFSKFSLCLTYTFTSFFINTKASKDSLIWGLLHRVIFILEHSSKSGKLAIWQISKVRAERYYWKTHPIINLRIFGHDTDRISGKLIQNHAFSRKIYFTDSRASYEITVLFMTRKRGKRRIRHKTTLKLNFKIDPKSTEDQVV